MLLSKKLLVGINPNFEILNEANVTNALNCLGQELESVKKHYLVNDLKIGYVENFLKHPNSEHLNVVSVKTINDTRTIVCGAPIMQKNRYVCVASIGSKMVNGITLETRQLRGVESNGMICAYHELTNINNDSLSKKEKDNVIFLDNDVNFSTDIYDYLGLNDTIFDIFIQSNRNDLNGAYYLGKSLAAFFNLKYPKLHSKIKINDKLENFICEYDNFINGMGLMRFKTNNHTMPWKYKSILINAGIKTYDNINDYASYLSYLFAIPYLAVDGNKVELPLIIRKSDVNTEWTIDNKVIKIRKNDIIVVDKNNKIVSLSNLVVNPELITDNSNNVLLLSFNTNILESRRLIKFNKINNQNALLSVKNNTSAMIVDSQKFCLDSKIGYNLFSEKVEILKTCKPNDGKKVKVTLGQINNFLGTNLSYFQYKKILEKYDFKVSKKSVVSSPIRTDSMSMQDIAEDVLVGFDLNKMQTQPINFETTNQSETIYDLEYKIQNYLVNLGFFESKTYNLTSLENTNNFNWYELPVLCLNNPISNIKSCFNINKIDSLLNVIAYNLRLKNNDVNWFEISKLYKSKQESFDLLTISLNTKWFVDRLSNSQLTNSLNNCISILNNILRLSGKNNICDNDLIFNTQLNGCYKENSIKIVKENRLIGYICQITKNKLKDYKIDQDVFIISINLSELSNLENRNENVQLFSNLNDITRSINVYADYDFNLINLVKEIKNICYIVSVEVVDKYKDEKGYSYIIEYKINNNSNIESKELDFIQERIFEILKNNRISLK